MDQDVEQCCANLHKVAKSFEISFLQVDLMMTSHAKVAVVNLQNILGTADGG